MTQKDLQALLKRMQAADPSVVMTTKDGKKAIVNSHRTLYTF
jgi:hypothetical protein